MRIALVTGLANMSPFFVYALCLAVGFLLPDFWLGKRITAAPNAHSARIAGRAGFDCDLC